MINMLTSSFLYICSDQFFWPSMAFTTMIGLFIGAVIYNGDVEQIRKAIIFLGSYAGLIIMVNLSRILSHINPEHLTDMSSGQPFASTATLLMVTAFYLFGMFLGVRLVKRAHKK